MTHTTSNALATSRLREELAYLKLPSAAWTAAGKGPDGLDLPDVAIIGAGMFGIAAAVALILKGVHNIRLFDSQPSGRSGPWTTYARMPTLRSPKDLPGLSFGIRALTFRAWYEATYSAEAWEALYKIPNAVWQDYLEWIAEAFDLPIEHNAVIRRFSVGPQTVTLQHEDGRSLIARRLVIATGRSGAGARACLDLSIRGCFQPARPTAATRSTLPPWPGVAWR